MRQHAGGSDHEHGVAERRDLVFAGDQPVARGECQLHRVGEADHHDERRHHVEEHVQAEAEPAERSEREQDGEDRRERRDDHERDAPEEHDRDQAAGEHAGDVVDDAVARHRVADLELHDRHARELADQIGALHGVGQQFADFADHRPEPVARDHLRIERQHDQRQRAVVGQKLAAQDLVGSDGLDEFVVGRALGQLVRKQRGRKLAGLRRLAGGEKRDNSARSVDKLNVRDKIAKLLQRGARKQRLALDHHQHVEFGRREALGDLLVLAEFLGVRPEQLAQRVIDLDALETEEGADAKQQQDDHRRDRRPHRDQTQPLDAERNAWQRAGRLRAARLLRRLIKH